MNFKLLFTYALSSLVLLGCPTTNDNENINEIPPKNEVPADSGVAQTGSTDSGTTAVVTGDAGMASEVTDSGTAAVVTSDAGTASQVTDSGTAAVVTSDAGMTSEVTDSGTPAPAASDAGMASEAEDGGAQASLPWDFTSFGGCGFVYIYGKNTADTVGLHFDDGDLNSAVAAYESSDAGIAFTAIFDLGSDSDRLRIEEGTNITHESCDDAPWLTVTIDRTWRPISGTATLTVTSDGESTAWGEYPAGAVLLLENVVLSPTDDASVTVTIESMTIEAGVGWMPG